MSEVLTSLQDKTLKCIQSHFRDNPITGLHIAAEINLDDKNPGKEGADMRSIINALRTKGHPVCANGKGYFWPRNYDELHKYIDEFQKRINDQQKALDGLRLIILRGPENIGKIRDEDLDEKLRYLLSKSHLSFDDESRKRVYDLNYALKSRENFLKRNAIKKYND